MVQEMEIREALEQPNGRLVDVRSPCEFQEASIPGAVNIPLFDDAERHLIGLTYHNRGPRQARELGMELVGPRLASLYRKVSVRVSDQRPFLFCWRGGMRSEIMSLLLAAMGLAPVRIRGGYKAFRRMVLEDLEEMPLPGPLLVLDGLTGAGKTRVLEELSQRGHPVLNLEDLARHRGSVFGSLGQERPRGQKMFDALLWERLRALGGSPYVLVEGESKKIGPIYLPQRLVEAMQKAPVVRLQAGLETRVQRILEEYSASGEIPWNEARRALDKLGRRLGTSRVQQLRKFLCQGDAENFVRLLLKEYYDPLYKKGKDSPGVPDLEVQADDLQAARSQVEAYLEQKFSPGSGAGAEGSPGAFGRSEGGR